ncbi:hypothetical protein [Diaphorobacter caeni]|uniref:hypothetical protein n=1 Tax=Diaphorobacter caeni TaxID=2784387 RepID=UPI00188F8382|nr:hypothetical protein [Diaphorobacter caeni]MBF5006358.1 hypothetical protein [Diaphorobacter caeni]
MPIQKGDIRFARSSRMVDKPEGGGPPSAQLLTSGKSNEIFPDISQESRTVGRVEIYSVFGVLRNTDTAPLLGANVVIAEPPADPNVSVTMLSVEDSFATRADIVKRIEAGRAPGPEFGGYLLENAFASTLSFQVFQRPEMSPPTVGLTYLLIYNEGLATERRQRVRIKSIEVEVRKCAEYLNNGLVEFDGQIVTCELFDPLSLDFPGSPATRTFARGAGKTIIRSTVYSDTRLFAGVTRLAESTQVDDVWLQLETVFTQVVHNSRSEANVVNQKPTSRATLTLATEPRKVEVGTTPHTYRIKISEQNQGRTYVLSFKQPPAPGTVFIDYWSGGQRYTIYDDGTGRLTGFGGGAISYLNNTGTCTLQGLPDIGSSISVSYGTAMSFSSRSSQGALVRAPKYSWVVEGDTEDDAIVPSSLSIKYPSQGVLRTVTDNGSGKLTGAGTGVVDYPSCSVLMDPAFMPDAGAEFVIECQVDALITEIIAPGATDPAGFVHFQTAQAGALGSHQITWVTSRQVSNTSGGQLTTTTASKDTEVTYTTRAVPEYYEPAKNTGASGSGGTGGTTTTVNWPRSTPGA